MTRQISFITIIVLIITFGLSCKDGGKTSPEKEKGEREEEIIIPNGDEPDENVDDTTSKTFVVYSMRSLVEGCNDMKKAVNLVLSDNYDGTFEEEIASSCNIENPAKKILSPVEQELSPDNTTKILWFEPGGTYIVTEPITIRTMTKIVGGAGYYNFLGSREIPPSSNTPPQKTELVEQYGSMLICRTSSEMGCINLVGANGSTIKRLIIKTEVANPDKYGITIFNSEDIELNEIFIDSFSRANLYIDNTSNSTFSDLYINGSDTAFGIHYKSGTNNKLLYSVIQGGLTGIQFNKGNLTVSDSSFETHAHAKSKFAINMTDGNLTVSRCRFEIQNPFSESESGPKGGAIQLNSSRSDTILEINDNYLYIPCSATGRYPIYISKTTESAPHVVIEGNTFRMFGNECPVYANTSRDNISCSMNLNYSKRYYIDNGTTKSDYFRYPLDSQCSCETPQPERYTPLECFN